MNHLDYRWYAPHNTRRQMPEHMRAWCAEAGLEIEREQLQESGITVDGRKE